MAPMVQTQVSLVTISVFTLIAYIIVSSYQIYETKQNYIDDNRPFVFPTAPSFIERELVQIQIINYGKTPAYKYHQWCRLQRCDTPDDTSTFLLRPNDTREDYLAPSAPDIVFVPKDKKRWDTTSAHYFLIGCIWYDDNWKRPHRTIFAYQWMYGIFTRVPEYGSTN
jgi:hypothetical protein